MFSLLDDHKFRPHFQRGAGGFNEVLLLSQQACLAVIEDQAVDVFFGDFLANPMAVVHEIYDRLGIELTPEAERRMVRFLAEHPQEKYGGHAYTFADTGLDANIWRERMRPYQEYFDVPDEALP